MWWLILGFFIGVAFTLGSVYFGYCLADREDYVDGAEFIALDANGLAIRDAEH